MTRRQRRRLERNWRKVARRETRIEEWIPPTGPNYGWNQQVADWAVARFDAIPPGSANERKAAEGLLTLGLRLPTDVVNRDFAQLFPLEKGAA